MKRHENHFDKSRVDASLRTEGRAHRRNKAASYPVAQLVEALRNKPEGRGFDNRWDHQGFSLTESSLWSTHPLTEISTRSISWG